jgi:predicted RNase H-like HicB family nuclease
MRKTRQFLVNLIYDPEYNGYVADVPQLAGCMSQGKTVEAALRNVRQATRIYLKTSPKPQFGKAPDQTPSPRECNRPSLLP